MFYQWYELGHASMIPWRAVADAMRIACQSPLNPWAHTVVGHAAVAGLEVFERSTRRYEKPEFGLTETELADAGRVAVQERIVWSRPFCNLLHFQRKLPKGRSADPKILIVAPMSGHYATLVRGTVERFLPEAEVYVTDWMDARTVPVSAGKFDLDDFIDYLISMLHILGEDVHVVAVCQPAVPVLAAAALMEEDRDRFAPSSMTLMGGPIDTRRSPTVVDRLAEEHPIEWFRQNLTMPVPWPHRGFMRNVYPGFLQLSGFISMNLDKHMAAQREFFVHLVEGDGEPAEKHRAFYDEYRAVMDLTAEFYLQTVETVFIRHALPKGEMMHYERRVDTTAIRNVALFTVEGENDDISGLGQTKAAHDLCPNIPAGMKHHYVQPKVGHYGVFNGSRFRGEIAPRILDFIRTNARPDGRKAAGKGNAAA